MEPPVGTPGFENRDAAENDRNREQPAIYAKTIPDYGQELHDSRGHVFCSIKEYGHDDDIIITVKRDKRHYYIYFPYSPNQPDEERIA